MNLSSYLATVTDFTLFSSVLRR